MKGTNLTYGQMIAIGVAILFGVPICLGIVAWYFLGFWLGVIVVSFCFGVLERV